MTLKERIDSITKLIPLIYPIIIFLGYYNYYVYYSFFDIDIFHYLNIYELLFSFISLVIPIGITIFLVFCYFTFVLVIPNISDTTEESDKTVFDDSYLSSIQKRLRRLESNKEYTISLIFNKSHQNLSRSWILFVHKIKQKKYSRAFSHFTIFLSGMVSFLIKIALWLFFLFFSFAAFELLFSPIENSLNYFKPFFTSSLSTIISLITWLSITYAIIFKRSKNLKKVFVGIVQVVPIIFLLLFSLTLYQKIKAEKTINHKTNDIRFSYIGKNVESNSKIVYLGRTSDFVFLRDLAKETNLIYPIKDVSSFEIRKLKEKKEINVNKVEK